MISPQENTRTQALEYKSKGRTLLPKLMSPIVAANMTGGIQKVIKQIGTPLLAAPRVGEKPAYEIYGYKWWPMATYHFGLTPLMETLIGVPLTPTYAFFRSYQLGDICRIHADRAACEHSLSLTLGYADDAPWALSVENTPLSEEQYFKAGQEADYGSNSYTDFPMQAGDAVLYKGIEHRHGRLAPNPNRWSAHMFLHWISTDGPYTSESYDGLTLPGSADFNFPS
ncbi:MAG: hypothetical protein ACPGVT_03500 [Maricaulaceae bacterium]